MYSMYSMDVLSSQWNYSITPPIWKKLNIKSTQPLSKCMTKFLCSSIMQTRWQKKNHDSKQKNKKKMKRNMLWLQIIIMLQQLHEAETFIWVRDGRKFEFHTCACTTVGKCRCSCARHKSIVMACCSATTNFLCFGVINIFK